MTAVSLQDSAGRLGEVMAEQTARLQELRRQLSSGVGLRADSGSDLALELQAVQEELRLALRREKESQELSRSQAARVDSLTRMLHVKEELIRVSRREREHVHTSLSQHTTGKHLCVCVCSAGLPDADGGALSSPAGGAVDPGGSGAEGEPGPAGRSPGQRARPGP